MDPGSVVVRRGMLYYNDFGSDTQFDFACELVGIIFAGFSRSVASDCVWNDHRARRGIPRHATSYYYVFAPLHQTVSGISTSSSGRLYLFMVVCFEWLATIN